jgi:Reverse transcriptase (RNA-dependent DNA polymerase)
MITPTDTMLQIYPTRETTQGNVLTPMLWNCIVNCFGDIMDNLNIGGCIFADDIVVAMRGNDINHTHAVIQRTLNQSSTWANVEGLRFNIGKSHSMLSVKDKNFSLPPIKLNEQIINQLFSIKYLGVLMDGGLKWNDHLNQVVEMAKKDMMRINTMLNKILGPKLTHWVYTAVIHPKITYAAHDWCSKISNYKLEKILHQIQRWALTKLGPIRENTPTAGLEIITKTAPLHIHLQEVSLKTIYNFKN